MSEVNYLKLLDSKTLTLVRNIGKFADKEGVKAYVVGGVVRDLILGKKSVDLDIVVESDAVSFAQKYAEQLNKKITAHPRFKTATVWLDKKQYVDFVMSRREIYKVPGALPTVYKSHLNDDLFRRDFTINAIGISINKETFGCLFDPYNGLADIKAKKVRILHDMSFSDDPTRILRAIRFEQRFGFQIERKTLKLLKEALKKKYECTVTPGRYYREFEKTFKEDDPVKCFRRLNSLKAWNFLQKKFQCDIGRMAIIQKEQQKRRKLDQLQGISIVYLAGLLESLSTASKKEIGLRFQIPRKSRKILELEVT